MSKKSRRGFEAGFDALICVSDGPVCVVFVLTPQLIKDNLTTESA